MDIANRRRYHTKLTAAQVREIRRRADRDRRNGKLPRGWYTRQAREFGVWMTTIQYVLRPGTRPDAGSAR